MGYNSGALDVIGGLQNDVTFGAGLAMPVEAISASLGLRYVGFNHTREPFYDFRIRRALALAINREQLVGEILRGTVDLASRITPPGIDSAPLDLDLPFDLEQALQLLAEAGFPDPQALGHLQFIFAVEGNNELVVQALSQMWQEIGINISLVGVPDLREYSRQLNRIFTSPEESKIQLYYGFWGADYLDPQNVLSQQLHTVPGVSQASYAQYAHNNGHYHNPDFDGLVESADKRTSVNAALQNYRTAERLALEDMACCPLFYPRPKVLIRDGVNGLVVTGQGIIIPNYSALTSTL